MEREVKLPIKVVEPLEKDYFKPHHGGGEPKAFVEVTSELRRQLSQQVIEVRDSLRDAFEKYPGVPAVAMATVRGTAVAKSHRPTRLLSQDTCPIIGGEKLGEILISVSPSGLDALAARIERDRTREGIANISTLVSVHKYEPAVDIASATNSDGTTRAKVKLFQHRSLALDGAIDEHFGRILKGNRGSEVQPVHYGPGVKAYCVTAADQSVLGKLSEFVGTQSIGAFPTYFPVEAAAVPIGGMTVENFPPPDPDGDYPIVGVIDTGVNVQDPRIAEWVVDRYEYIPAALQTHLHGSFVCGLIARAQALNHGDNRFPSCSAKIVDVVVLSSRDRISEDDLLLVVEDAIERFPYVKIWNLSFDTECPCRQHRFSDFAVKLDSLQDKHRVMFILAAGNYRNPPFRGWPPEDLGTDDLIRSPADSVRSVVVGSLAHRDHASARVRDGQPSPFSRKGPGPLYLPKPEVSHIGGNCCRRGTCNQIGVISVDDQGNVCEDKGTSYSTPLISTLAANIQHNITDGASGLLTRALIVHSAALRTGRLDPQSLPYQGFGIPGDIDDILGCEPWRATTIFELTVTQGMSFEKSIFPMPKCLYIDDDTVKANILMTLVYDPELDAQFGSEYCRSNIEVSLGTYDEGKDGKHHQTKKVPEEPHLLGKGYETDLVAYGFKWSPVKVYRREMVRGLKGKLWRLEMSVHHRSGHRPQKAQNAVLVITVADPAKRAPVYNDMIVQMRNLGWVTQDLQLRSRIRS